jgi:opacity protein-like surface antigen
VALIAMSWVSAAAAAPSVYVSAGAGAADAPNGTFEGTGIHVDFDLGKPIGVLALGVDFADGWRFELEGGYRYNDTEVVFFDDGRSDWAVDSESVLSANTLGLNAIYQFDPDWAFKPYLGAGLGAAWVDYEINQYITDVRMLDDSDTVLAYQLIAGLAMPLGEHWALGLDYRYWRAPQIELDDVNGEPFDTDHAQHSAMLHVRYGFGASVRRAPAPRPARQAGWYTALAGGPARAKDAEVKDNLTNFDAFDVGPAFALAAGYRFAGPWRLELEAARRRVEAELIDFNPEFGEDRANGHVRSTSLMASLAYEPDWKVPFQPYAAIGAGMVWSDWDVTLNQDGSTWVDDDASALAYQVAVGAVAPLTDRLAMTVEYRFWLSGQLDLAEPDGTPMRTELTVTSLMLGLRYHW